MRGDLYRRAHKVLATLWTQKPLPLCLNQEKNNLELPTYAFPPKIQLSGSNSRYKRQRIQSGGNDECDGDRAECLVLCFTAYVRELISPRFAE